MCIVSTNKRNIDLYIYVYIAEINYIYLFLIKRVWNIHTAKRCIEPSNDMVKINEIKMCVSVCVCVCVCVCLVG